MSNNLQQTTHQNDALEDRSIGPAPCSAWVEETQGTAFLVCDWGDEESAWFPINPDSDLAPSRWADHPADNAPVELQQKLWDLIDVAWNEWKRNREGSGQ